MPDLALRLVGVRLTPAPVKLVDERRLLPDLAVQSCQTGEIECSDGTVDGIQNAVVVHP